MGLEPSVAGEVSRLQRLKAERREAEEKEWSEHLMTCMRRMLREFEAGKRNICTCTACLTGLLTLDGEKLCSRGKDDFRSEVNSRKRFKVE